jgi:hypothetical protein
MDGFIALIEAIAPDFSSGLKAKAGIWILENAQAIRSK